MTARPHRLSKASLLLVVLASLAWSPRSVFALDLNAPAAQKLKGSYAGKKAALETQHKTQLKALIDRHIRDATRLLIEKKRAGNVSGIASAGTAVTIFEAAGEQIEKDGDFSLPENVRRELRTTMSQVGEEKKGIDDQNKTALAALDEECRAQLAELAAAEGAPDLSGEQLHTFFSELMTAPDAAPVSGAPSGADVAPGSPAEPGRPAATNGTPQVVASSDAATEWVPIARWFAGVSRIEVVSINVAERVEREHREVAAVSPLSRPYEVTYEPIRRLSPSPGCKFQLKTLPGHEAPAVVEWPTAANGWTLQVRVRPSHESPSKHGAEILVAFPGAEALPLLSERESEAGEDGVLVRIGIKTAPPEASVYVDGRPYRDGSGFPKTPCVVSVRPGKRNIRLRKFGYKDAVVVDFEAAEGLVVARRLEKDLRVVDKTLTVSAMSRGWQTSGVEVSHGDVLHIKATGEWNCASGKESVNGEGYPNNKDFYTYYINPKDSPRILAGAHYGALIMRIGRDGPAVKIGTGVKLEADRAGTVYFDVNEAPDTRLRRDNGGALSVRLLKVPGGM